jgi:hypothetical protein
MGVKNPVLIAAAAGSLSLALAVIAMRHFEPAMRQLLTSRRGGSENNRGTDRLVLSTN